MDSGICRSAHLELLRLGHFDIHVLTAKRQGLTETSVVSMNNFQQTGLQTL